MSPHCSNTIGSALSGHAGFLSPAWQAISAGRQFTSSVAGAATGDKDTGQVFKSAVTATGYLLGVPISPKQGTYLWDVTFGDEEPEDAAEPM